MLDECHPIARVPFTDGSMHPVYADADGRQFVLGGEVLVYGTWVRPDGADEPMIVGR